MMVRKNGYHYLILDIGYEAGNNTLQFIKHLILVASKVMERISHFIFTRKSSFQSTIKQELEKENLLTPQPKIANQVWLEKPDYELVITIENSNTIRRFILDEQGNLPRKYYSN